MVNSLEYINEESLLIYENRLLHMQFKNDTLKFSLRYVEYNLHKHSDNLN